MNKAIIFDMDGVIIRSEDRWNALEATLFPKILAPHIAKQMIGTTRGMSEYQIYQRMCELGHTGSKKELYDAYEEGAQSIYAEGVLTENIDAIIHTLHTHGAKLGIVSASPVPWIKIVLQRLPHAADISFVESVSEHPELRPKPAPDGYLAAMKALGVEPSHSLIVEDSQTGINAAVASGAHVCCLTVHHIEEPPAGVEIYARSSKELEDVCLRFLHGEYIGE